MTTSLDKAQESHQSISSQLTVYGNVHMSDQEKYLRHPGTTWISIVCSLRTHQYHCTNTIPSGLWNIPLCS